MNRIDNSSSFNVNDKNYGIACTNIPSDIPLYPIVILYYNSDSIEILD